MYRLAWCVLACVVLPAAVAQADIATVYGSSNVSLSSTFPYPNTNHVSTYRASTGMEVSYLAFDTSAVGGTVSSVRLWLYENNIPAVTSSTGPASLGIYAVTGNWNESSITWSNQPSVAGAPVASQTIAAPQSGSQWVSWDVTGAWESSSSLDFMLRDDAPLLSGYRWFGFSPHGDGDLGPYLEVTYEPADYSVPEPCSLLLLGGSTLFGLRALRRRRTP